MNTKHVWTSVRAISVTALLANLSACAVSDEVDNQTIELADKLAASGGPTANPTSDPEPDDMEPVATGEPSANPTTSPTTSPTSTDEPDPEGDAGAMPGGSGGAGGTGGNGGNGGDDGVGGNGGASGGPAMDDPPASMDWETCEPVWATHFCPDLDCETTTLCTGEQEQYETNCRTWCSEMMDCVSENPDCVEEEDPLCISSYSPRDKCIDALEMTNNYAGSFGTKAATALVECACGGAN